MKNVLSIDNMRASDKATIEGGAPSLELMWRAATGIYESYNKWENTLIVCGAGNNAGDGYALALILEKNGVECTVLTCSDTFSADGKYYFDRCVEAGIRILSYDEDTVFSSYSVIVDCIFGTGFHGEAASPYREIIEKINKSGAYIISADINSGLNGDNGLCDIAVKSDLTVAIGGYKSGHFLNKASDYISSLASCDIGIEPQDKTFYLFEKSDVRKILKKRSNFSHKGTYGYITLIGGSYEYSGAVKLSSLAAAGARSGAGVVRLCAPDIICQGILPYILESTLFPLSSSEGKIRFNEEEIKRATEGAVCVGLGMGMGQGEDNEKIIEYLLKNYSGILAIDADGINSLAKMDKEILKNSLPCVVLTPHIKEMERLCGITVSEILKAPIDISKSYAKEMGVYIALKGNTTVITDGEDVILTNTGSPAMAKGGSGDVLSGVLCAILAQNRDKDILSAVACATYINGYAGEKADREMGEISALPSDTARNIGLAIKELTE